DEHRRLALAVPHALDALEIHSVVREFIAQGRSQELVRLFVVRVACCTDNHNERALFDSDVHSVPLALCAWLEVRTCEEPLYSFCSHTNGMGLTMTAGRATDTGRILLRR